MIGSANFISTCIVARCDKVLDWLYPKPVLESNKTHHGRHMERLAGKIVDSFTQSNVHYYNWRNADDCCPVLWIHAPPGSGKSMLCSRIIEHIKSERPSSPVAYHFFQFDQMYSPCEVLQHLAYHLLDKFRLDRKYEDPNALLPDDTEREYTVAYLRKLIAMLIKSFSKVFFIVDGLDEEHSAERWTRAKVVIDVLIDLQRKHAGVVRVLFSSQLRDPIRETLGQYNTVDIADHLNKEMAIFLESAVSSMRFARSGQEIVAELQDRAAGSFLWASLMVDELRGAESPARRTDMLNSNLSTLDDHYMKLFGRFKSRHKQLAW